MSYCTVSTGNNAGLNVRASRSTGSALQGVINNGVSVNVVRCDDTWATLLFNGSPAFVQHQYLTNPPTGNGQGLARNDTAVCNANSVIIRQTANGTATGSYLQKGDAVTIVASGYINSYYWYRIGDNRWVRGDYLTPATNTTGGGNSSNDNDENDDNSVTTINVRSGPGTGFNRIYTISSDSDFTVLFRAKGSVYNGVDDWYYITWFDNNDNQCQGYINGSFVSNTNLPAEHPSSMREAFGFDVLGEQDYGIYVYNVQLALYDRKYLIDTEDCDGYYGSMTKTAVREFQNANQLTVDGVVGIDTKNALWEKAYSYLRSAGVVVPNG